MNYYIIATSFVVHILCGNAYAQGTVEPFDVESCTELEAYVGMDYLNVSQSPKPSRHFLSTVCIAKDKSWFDGPDRVDGFSATIDFGAEGGMYEVIDQANRSSMRSALTMGSLAEMVPFELGVEAFSVGVKLNATTTGPMPDADLIQGYGYGLDSGVTPLAKMPDGRWVIFLHAYQASDLKSEIVNVSAASLGETAVVLHRNADEIDRLITPKWAEGFEWRGLQLDITVTEGAPSGSVAFDITNPKIPEARDPKGFDSASIRMTEFIGRGVESRNGGLIIGQGAGHMDARIDEGTQQTHLVWFSIVSFRIPDEIPDAMVNQFLSNF
jgi:hypothetical protein